LTASHRIGVRDLVFHVIATGDLSYGFTGSGRLIKAIRAHQKIQRQRPAGYQPEVAVSHTVESSTIKLIIGGRIDGIWPTDEGILVEEIKTTTLPPNQTGENLLHLGQLKSYAYMYAVANDLDTIKGQLTYYHLETGQTSEYCHTFDLKTLTSFFNEIVSSYLTWVETIDRRQNHRNSTINQLAFPYSDYRPGQRRMAVAVFRAIRDNTHLMAQAATGIGKTMAVLFPAIKAIADGLTEKIVYLTARTTGRLAAEQTLNILRKNGLELTSLSLTAKDKICFVPDANCSAEECPFAKDYYDRCKAAMETALKQDALTRTNISEIARHHTICPFAFSLMLAKWVDVIICDYNYAFNPRVLLRELFEEKKQAYTFLVDEAHNLVDRSRDMFSATLTKDPFLTVRRLLKNDLPELHRQMGRINQWFLNNRKKNGKPRSHQTDKSAPDELTPALWAFIRQTDRWLAKNRKASYKTPLLELYFQVTHFLRVLETFDDRYITCYESTDRDFEVRLFCIDPSFQLASALKRSRATIFFSATLTPMTYFIDIFGCDKATRQLTIPSPFPPHHLCVIICNRISTRYRDRDKTCPTIKAAIGSTLKAKLGNYLCFFPSYEYMLKTHALFMTNCPDTEVEVQTLNMTETAREDFIKQFSINKHRSLVGFAVLGGIFGEGINLVGDRLSGVVIIGVGLPAISWQRELIRNYFKLKTGLGYEYAYIYPGINRVCQAAGRVIRTKEDIGAIVLIDDRLGTALYRRLLPATWRLTRVRHTDEIQQVLTDFWQTAHPDSI